MGMFIILRVDQTLCLGGTDCARCVDVCPVDVFTVENGALRVDTKNEDECTLCELCLQGCPQGALKLMKLYGE